MFGKVNPDRELARMQQMIEQTERTFAAFERLGVPTDPAIPVMLEGLKRSRAGLAEAWWEARRDGCASQFVRDPVTRAAYDAARFGVQALEKTMKVAQGYLRGRGVAI